MSFPSSGLQPGSMIRRLPVREKNLLLTVLFISITALAASWMLVRVAEDYMIENAARTTAVKWASYLENHLVEFSTVLEDGRFPEEETHLFEMASKAGNVFRHKLFQADGTILHASRESDIGQVNTKPYFTEIVKKGRTYVKIEREEDFGAERTVVSEAYVPFMDGDEFRGAIEVYVDMTSVAVQMREIGDYALVGLFSVLGLFGAACGFFVARNIQVRNEELLAIKESERRALAAETDLVQVKNLAQEANRAKSEFLANMSHELRTPLNAVIGFSEIIKSETFGPVGSPKYRDYAVDINASGHHLLELINDILDLSKVESGQDELHEEDIPIAEVIHSVVTLVKERADKNGVKLDIECPDALPALRADKRKLKQILVNLLSNAIKFTDAGGSVTLRIWFRAESGHVFQVADTGIGIAPENIPKALSPFGQIDSDLNRQYDGSGLGLPLTKGLAELHGGILDLQSTPGVGTTVTVRFPATRIVVERRHGLTQVG